MDSRRAGRGKDRGSAFAAKSIALLVETLKILRLWIRRVRIRSSLAHSSTFLPPSTFLIPPSALYPNSRRSTAKKIDLIYIVPHIPILSSSRSFMFVESTDTSFITMQQAAREGIRNPRSVILTRETRRDNLRERVSTLIRCVVSSFRNEINRFSAGTN